LLALTCVDKANGPTAWPRGQRGRSLTKAGSRTPYLRPRGSRRTSTDFSANKIQL